MGNVSMTIHAVGSHHNHDNPRDLNKMFARFVDELKAAGHNITHAHLHHGAAEDMLDETTATRAGLYGALAATSAVAVLAAALFAAPVPVFAADVNPAKKATLLAPIPATGCGFYVGINTMGGAGAVAGSPVPGAQIVQGEIGVDGGYTCASATNSTFWFVEGMVDATNLNGGANGFNMSGPVDFFQRGGWGTPISTMLSLFPPLNTLSTPSLPALPNGVTAGPGAAYLYAGLHETDISAQYLESSGRLWVVAPEIGVGMRYRLSNAVMADVWTGWESRSNGVCIGAGGCPGIGNMWRVGFKLDY